MVVSLAGESVYSVGVRGKVWQEWAADGCHFGCAGSGFRTEGGDPGEKVFHIDANRDCGDNSSRLLGSKRRFQLKEVP